MPYINQPGGSAALSGVTVTGTGAAGKVPVASSSSAASWAFPPGFEIGYDQITGNVNIVSTTEATGTTIITCAAHTFDGAPVLAEFFSPIVVTGTTSSSQVVISLFEAATQITRLGILQTPAGVQNDIPFIGCFRFTPTAASHTYTVTAFTTNVTGTPLVGAGSGGTAGNAPSYMRFTKV